MNARFIQIICSSIALLIGLPCAAPQRAMAHSLCTTYVGPAFILTNESRSTIAVHAGSFPGISLLSLTTGRIEGRISVRAPILAGIMPPGSGRLLLAVSDGGNLRILSFDVTTRRLMSADVLGDVDARLVVFAPNAKLLLGVKTTGTVFKAELDRRGIKEANGINLAVASLAVSPGSTKLYVSGDGLTIMDIGTMKVSSVVSTERNLLEVAASPNDQAVVVRNWHNIEVFDPAKADTREALASTVVDQTPNGASTSSARRLAFSADGSELFYIRASDDEPKLISMSTNDLHIVSKVQVGPYPNAVAFVPELGWVLVTAGFPEAQYLEAIDMNTHRVMFKAPLRGGSPASTTRPKGCVTGAGGT